MRHNQLKYGRVERERRFLLEDPPDLSQADAVYDIEDRYIRTTRLRLRRMHQIGGDVVFKLARKLPPHAPGAGIMGNLYLDATEHSLLFGLPADIVHKRRHIVGTWAIDVFTGHLSGLALAESEVDSDAELAALVPPFPVLREVTEDPRYTGWQLAQQAPGKQ